MCVGACRLLFPLTLAIHFALSSAASAHPVSVSRTLVHLSPQVAQVTIEVFLEDLYLFHNLQPNAANALPRSELDRGLELHRQFVANRFVIRDQDGHWLRPAQLPEVTVQLPDDGVPLQELMTHPLQFDYRVVFESAPQFLTFEQNFNGDEALLPAEMQLHVVQQGGTNLLQRSLVAGQPQTIRIDWSTVRPGEESSEEERQRWLKHESEATLGISSYSSVYSFLYVEDFEIRHEILMPLLILEESLPLPRNDSAFLSLEEQDQVRPQIEAWFAAGNPVTIDGRLCSPTVERCDFYGVNFTDFAQMAERRDVAMSSGRVGIILSYPVTQPASSVSMVWDRFSKSLWAVRLLLCEGETTEKFTLSRLADRNTLDWNCADRTSVTTMDPLPAIIPRRAQIESHVVRTVVVSLLLVCGLLLLAGRRRIRSGVLLLAMAGLWQGVAPSFNIPLERPPALSSAESDSVVRRLVPQIYDSFRYRQEEAIYDALMKSVDGPLLQDVYLQLRQGLKMQQQGGAVSRIQNVTVVSTSPMAADPTSDEGHFSVQCLWNVKGTVEHWGHIHQRQNQFQGTFEVRAIEGFWKLTGLNITNEQQLAFSTQLRTLNTSPSPKPSPGQ